MSTEPLTPLQSELWQVLVHVLTSIPPTLVLTLCAVGSVQAALALDLVPKYTGQARGCDARVYITTALLLLGTL